MSDERGTSATRIAEDVRLLIRQAIRDGKSLTQVGTQFGMSLTSAMRIRDEAAG